MDQRFSFAWIFSGYRLRSNARYLSFVEIAFLTSRPEGEVQVQQFNSIFVPIPANSKDLYLIDCMDQIRHYLMNPKLIID